MKPGPSKPPAIRIWKETAHRGGKGVSAIHGVPLPGPQLEEICSALKKKCGTVLGSPGEFDTELLALCKVLSRL